MKEQIHKEWGSIYLRSDRGKAHLFEGCQYVTEEMEPQDIDAYPVGHLEFCEACKEGFERWRQNTKPPKNQCERCSRKGIEAKYCNPCQREIRHKKAKNRL